jgi:VWFA-related protein
MTPRRVTTFAATVLMVTVLDCLDCLEGVAGPRDSQAAAAQQPKFQSTVEVTPIDVNVVDDRGRPIRDLTPADFTVHVDGNARRVVSAEWVALVADEKASPPTPLPEAFSTNESGTGGRLIVLAIDEPNIRFGGARGLLNAASSFVDHLSASDRVSAIGLGLGSPATPFTADRARVKEAIGRMTGQKRSGPVSMQYTVAVSEALAMANGDRATTEAVVARECRGERSASGLEACRQQVETEALQIAQEAQHGADQTIRGLRNLLLGLKALDAPKTLILISEGFVMDETTPEVIDLGALAASARTSVYALQLDDQLFGGAEARAPMASAADRRARSQGLETLAGASRGTLFTVVASASPIFDRIESELSGYYLLGLESDPRDRDGKPHPIRVDVPRRGATVRARRQILNISAVGAPPRSPREAVTAGLSSPLLMSALPLRVATFSLQGPEQSKVQLLIHADVGSDYSAPKRIALGYIITARDGQVVDSQAADARLAPAMSGVPSSLEYVAGAIVTPGEYTLKLAVADGDRVGTIEHPIHASLVDAGGVRLSELMVGGPVEPGEHLRPTIGYTVIFGNVHGYLEAYGPESASVKVKYEIAASEESPAILSADVESRQVGEGRALFTRVIPVRALPAGKYVLRAIVTAGAQPVKTAQPAKILTRAFELAPPRVLMTSAIGLENAGGSPSTDGELFLPVGDAPFALPFRRQDAVTRTVLEPFRARLAPPVKDAFEKGIALFAAGDDQHAETSLKAAIQPDVDSTAALAYLAACFAASGHDAEAASAWQTALVDGSDMPQIYLWLGDALLRSHAYAEARSVLEEASGRWPADARFTRPLALLYATFGKGREAVRTLERYIAAGHADSETLALGVEWIYQVHAAGAFVHTRAEDVKLARGYAGEYAKAAGAHAELVKQWLDYLEHEKR